ncbi:MAG: putative (di)nucleoside polyphosphate hydrolase [Verrucomicrobiales bacterium]|jgi:putative (di)nucleoside polyphosphate hydrolase
MEERYRPNVAGILQRPEDGRILVAERCDIAGAWQFPQGGVDKGEGIEEALYRELEEEIGLKPSDYQVVDRRDGYRYKFPKDKPTRGKYCGQEQTYFLCEFTGEESSIHLDGHKQEFADYKWILPDDFDHKAVPKFKRAVYEAVLHDFFGR